MNHTYTEVQNHYYQLCEMPSRERFHFVNWVRLQTWIATGAALRDAVIIMEAVGLFAAATVDTDMD